MDELALWAPPFFKRLAGLMDSGRLTVNPSWGRIQPSFDQWGGAMRSIFLFSGIFLVSLALWGCSDDTPFDPPPDDTEGEVYVAFEVHRNSLAVTDALYTYPSLADAERVLLAVGRSGRGLFYPSDNFATPLILDTEADLLAVYYKNWDVAWACGAQEDGSAVLRYYNGQRWERGAHSAVGNFMGISFQAICTDAGEILSTNRSTRSAAVIFQAPEGVRFNAITYIIGETSTIAVGDEGAIFHQYGTGDFVDETIAGGPNFVAIAPGTDPEFHASTVYAVGDDEIWQFLGGIWSLVYDLAGSPLNDIAVFVDGTALAVGDNGLILQKDEHGWWEDFIDEEVDLTAIAVEIDEDEIRICGAGGQTYKLTPSGWQSLNHHASGTWPVLHVTDGGQAFAVNGSQLLRFNGSDWVDFAVWGMGAEITSLHVVDPTHIWAVGVMGDGIDQFVLFYDGSDWSILKQASLDGFNAIWCDATGDNVFVAADHGQVWWRHDDIWELDGDFETSDAVHDLSGPALDNLLAVGDSGRIMRRGPEGWVAEASGTTADLLAVSGSVIVGDKGAILVYKGDSWLTAGLDLEGRLNAVWYGAHDDIWVVGDDATVMHFNGTAWTRLRTHLPGIDFLAVTGFGFEDVWIGGSEGYLLHNPD